MEPKTVRLNAYWEDQGIALCVRLLRADFDRLLRQIEYLHRHSAKAINDWQTRWAHVAARLDDFAANCDFNGGYTDPDDPCADEALLILRHHFSALKQS